MYIIFPAKVLPVKSNYAERTLAGNFAQNLQNAQK